MTDDERRALNVRAKKLARLTVLYQSCKCCWPIKRMRNWSGHAESCPSHELSLRFKREDADLRAELDGVTS